jgi:hypothetical protein
MQPRLDPNRSDAEFSYPGLPFRFRFPLPASQGATVEEVARGASFRVSISTGVTIAVTVGKKTISDFFGEARNPNRVFYRRLADANGTPTTRLRFFHGREQVDVEVRGGENPEAFLSTIVATFSVGPPASELNE